MYEFLIGDKVAKRTTDAGALVAFTEAEGFHMVTEILGVYALAHPDGRTGLVRVAA